MPAALQAKLLHVLQDREFTRLGSNRPIEVDVRVLAATNRRLEDMMQAGTFREDLYYRLQVIEIHVPPLRSRREEIASLVEFFLVKYGRVYRRPPLRPTPVLLNALLEYPWPGNIRELESTVFRAALSAPGRQIRAADVEFLNAGGLHAPSTPERLPSLRETERSHIVRILDAVRWNKKEAAKVLGISRGTLYRKITEFGLEPQARPSFRRFRRTGT